MDEASENDNPLRAAPILVATALATLFIAGSTTLIRTRRRSKQPELLIPDHNTAAVPETGEAKSLTARSKERRRRGKDPVKDLLKGGKKQQLILKSLPATSSAATGTSSSDALVFETMQNDGHPSPTSSGNLRPASPSPTAEMPVPLIQLAPDPPAIRTRQPTAPNPWDWDGQGLSKPATTLTPRFRSKSSSRAVPESPQQATSRSADDLTFPTLKTAPGSASPSIASGSNSAPGSGPGTPPPQTQLASLRGALEAARLREEKTRSELERATKDAEMLRWENGAWRRREAELQSQIHHLMHQLQGYAAHYIHQQHLQVPGSGATSPNSPASPAGFVPSPFAPPSPSGYAHFAGMPVFSPTGQSPPPFYGYAQQQPQPQHPPHPQQANLFSMLFPNAATSKSAGSGSRSGSSVSASASVSASSSSGADSPDLLPVANGLPLDRGRKRSRIHTADGRLGGYATSSSGWVEGWIGGGRDDNATAPEYDDDEDCGFSEALADAILKRPESIRVGSRRRKEKDSSTSPTPEDVEPVLFPSLMDFGPGLGVRPVEEVEFTVDETSEETLDAVLLPETDSGEVTPSPHATAVASPLAAEPVEEER